MAKSRDPLANSSIYLERNKEPEHQLWISVLSKAVEDAFQGNDFPEALKAISWIKRSGGDFKKVCQMAGSGLLCGLHFWRLCYPACIADLWC